MIFNLTQPVLDSAPKFTYTGTYEYIDGGAGNWRIKFLTSGVFTPLKDMLVDAFLVGAGGGQATRGSGTGKWTLTDSGGGAGGKTLTVKSLVLTSNTEYPIVIGEGGIPAFSGSNAGLQAGTGGATTAFGSSADGGTGGHTYGNGGSGGSGGGSSYGNGNTASKTGIGGSDGSAGTGYKPGTGQGTTTREFGEETGDLYSGGGAGYWGTGGDGGGGDSGHDGEPNTGGGGGGSRSRSIGYGGSGIVVIRKHKEAAA